MRNFFYSCLLFVVLSMAALWACNGPGVTDLRIKEMDSATVTQLAASIEASVKPEVEEGLSLHIWGADSLVISPIGISIDNNGKLYYTTTNRQKNSEFDIRGHRNWEIESISLQTVEERRAFLRKELSPENSHRNKWLKDLNGDSSHDWRDLTIETDHVYSLEDVNGDGIAEKTQLMVDDFNDEVSDVAGSVLKDGDDIYVAIAPDLWKMKDKNNDGIVDEKQSLSHGYGIHVGFSGHGMSGIEMGPDGRIYWQIGDIGFNGTGPDGKKWAYPNCGVIARCNPDGSDFEIFAAGLRNTHEFAFDEYGNLISEDNDGDHPGEKERLVYIVNGSDAGWRSNWQYGKYNDPKNNTYKVWMEEKMYLPRWNGQAAYIVPPVSNFVSGPAGFVYNPGTALSPQYKNTFFVAEFVGNPSNSGVYGFKLNPKGAGFELGEHRKIVSGVLTTGLDFGPDGALYLADWIDGWGTHNYGRIWKLDDDKAAQSAERIETKRLLQADFSQTTEAELGTYLTKADMRVRLKAQFELVKRGEKGAAVLQQQIHQQANQLARVNAIWGISQLARKEEKYAGILLPLLQDSDPEIRAQAAKWLGDMKYAAAGSNLIPLLKDTAARARFFAAEALGRIAYEPAVDPLIELLKANNDEDVYLRHAGCLALARIGKAAPLIQLSGSPSRALRIAAVVALRRMADPGIAVFLNDKDEFVVTETARAINDDLSIPAALPALGDLLTTTSYTNEPLIRRAINANLRTGTQKAMQNLADYSLKKNAPAAMRAEAIAALSVWSNPSVLDRVDGRLRGKIQREEALLKNKLAELLPVLLKDNQLQVRLGAAKAVAHMHISEGALLLSQLVKTDPEPAMRIEALASLVALGDSRSGEAVSVALSDNVKQVRVEGLDLLQQMTISKELMVSLLNNVIETKTLEEKQAAITTLGKIPLTYTQPSLEKLLDKMNAGQLDPALYLELGEAIDSSGNTALAERYKTTAQKFSQGDLMAAYASCLEGGDVNRGRYIFFRNETAQCMKCHAFDDRGGNAGPRLNGVAGRITRTQILEALISPGARIAPGYGTQGQPSSMPEVRYILTKREIRDLVSFLATLKTDE